MPLPTPLPDTPVPPPPAPAPNYAAFLQRQLPLQSGNVASYRLGDEQVWLKKAGPRHGMGRYRVLGALALAARLPVLRPVPNLGGSAAIATEAQRLRDLAVRGLRVPAVLAEHSGGLLLRHLGAPGQPTPSLARELEDAAATGAAAQQQLWAQGLQAIGLVHARGTSLSQAFARNLVRCPDGVVGYIDFEDDPASALPLALCQARDALCYVHSSALYLEHGGALPGARTLWADWLAGCSSEVRSTLQGSMARMHWARHLPASRRFGRDLQRVRAAYELLHA